MSKKKISIIFGTRPEAIKLAPVILALKALPEYNVNICVTAQHREMLDSVLETFAIVPDVDLNLMQTEQTLSSLTSRLLTSLDHYITTQQPDLVLVQGDTTTAFSAALASFYHRIPVGHIEAGLRTRDINAPFPEEFNRISIAHLAELHFAPTAAAAEHLQKESVDLKKIFITGNTVIDALFLAQEKIRNNFPVIPGIEHLNISTTEHPIVLITGHRRENFGKGFEHICKAVQLLSEKFEKASFIYPVHLNPSVREPVYRYLGGKKNIFLIDPLQYLPFVALMTKSTLILTDSGGIQEEAPSIGKPVLVMREKTERPEVLKTGMVKLIGTNVDSIIDSVSALLTDPVLLKNMSTPVHPYGKGDAALKIVKQLRHYFETH